MQSTLPERVNTGGLQSPFDYRDGIAAAAAFAAAKNEPPISIDLSKFPVLMQGQRPACVSHAIALIMQVYFFLKTGKLIKFSPRFLDALVKKYDGLPLSGSGAYPRLVMKMAAKYGCATVDVLPNDISLSDPAYRDPSILTDAVMANAAQYKIPGYVYVATDVQSSREGMRLFGPLAMLMRIGSEWWTRKDGVSSWSPADILPLRAPATIVSGHEIVRHVSADGDLDTLRNSWSEDWGLKGEATFHPSEYAPFINEQWAIASIPADAQQLLSELPAPGDFHYNFARDLAYGNATPDEDVKFAQIALMILGFLDSSKVAASELGYFGNKTAAAVLKYQQSKRITPPNAHAIGPKTRAALNADFAL